MLKRLIGVLIVLVGLVLFARSCVDRSGGSEVRIGRDPGWARLDVGAKANNLAAFSDELCLELSKAESFRVRMLSGDPALLMRGLREKKYHAVLASLPATDQNRGIYDLSDSYFYLGPVLVIPEGSQVTSPQDLVGETIGFDGQYPLTLSLLRDGVVTWVSYDGTSAAFEGMLAGDCAAVIVHGVHGRALAVGQYAGRVSVTDLQLSDEGLRMVALKGESTDLVNAFSATVKRLRSSGIYEEMLKKWALLQ